MHVKTDNKSDFDDIPVMEFIKDMETNFRDELFGNPSFASDFSESSSSSISDEDTRMFSMETNILGDFASTFSNGTGSCSRSSTSSSTSFEQMNVQESTSNCFKDFCYEDDDFPENVMVDPLNLELKQERFSPENISTIENQTAEQLWHFLNDTDIKPSIKIPESPPLTPPSSSPSSDFSPPLSPTSITSHEGLQTAIPTTAVITLTQVERPLMTKPKNHVIIPNIPVQVLKSPTEAKQKQISKNIQIQPRVNRSFMDKSPIPLIKMENGTPKVSLAPIGLKLPIDSRHKPMIMTPQHTSYVPASINIPECSSQLQAMKRQERMIKNRESASLSRKRKKEYLQGLEDKIKELDYENCRLTEENFKLKKRLAALENERSILKGTRFPMKRASSTALLGITFIFLLNVNQFLNFFTPSNPSSALNEFSSENNPSLLMSSSDFESGQKFSQRSLLWFSSSSDQSTMNGNLSTVCPLSVNATESIRIENELRDWFETLIESNVGEVTLKNSLKAVDSDKISKNTKHMKVRKNLRKKVEERALAKPTKDEHMSPDMYRYLYHPEKLTTKDEPHGLMAGVESFLRSFERRNDTYYVVALSSDHILLPASAHNTSARPKMSLLVPTSRSVGDLMDHQFSVMQIDCDVTRTQLVSYEKVPSNPEPLGSQFSPEGVSNGSSRAQPEKRERKTRRTKLVGQN